MFRFGEAHTRQLDDEDEGYFIKSGTGHLQFLKTFVGNYEFSSSENIGGQDLLVPFAGTYNDWVKFHNLTPVDEVDEDTTNISEKCGESCMKDITAKHQNKNKVNKFKSFAEEKKEKVVSKKEESSDSESEEEPPKKVEKKDKIKENSKKSEDKPKENSKTQEKETKPAGNWAGKVGSKPAASEDEDQDDEGEGEEEHYEPLPPMPASPPKKWPVAPKKKPEEPTKIDRPVAPLSRSDEKEFPSLISANGKTLSTPDKQKSFSPSGYSKALGSKPKPKFKPLEAKSDEKKKAATPQKKENEKTPAKSVKPLETTDSFKLNAKATRKALRDAEEDDDESKKIREKFWNQFMEILDHPEGMKKSLRDLFIDQLLAKNTDS